MKTPSTRRRAARQHGATVVEFAIVVALFLMLLLGMMEMGRMLYYWNAAVEATRLGARVAAVCDVNDSAIKTRMQGILDLLPTAQIDVAYKPAGCNLNTCTSVTVSVLAGTAVATYIPFVPLALTLPAFSTTLPRESMRSDIDGIANPVCD
jgi:Flp pilus assembly protein TadG